MIRKFKHKGLKRLFKSGISTGVDPEHVARIRKILAQFDRKAYMKVNKGISPATACRDLQHLVKEGILDVRGKGRMTQYRKK